MRENRGFSLIELIVVIAIMAIMGGFIFMGLGVLNGTDARECADNLDSALDKAKTISMSKSGVTDAYMELMQEADGDYYVKYYVPDKPMAKEEDANMICTSTQRIGKKNVEVTCSFEDGSTVKLSDTQSVKFYYDRISGAFKEAEKSDGNKEFCSKITIDKGKTYEMKLIPATGKHTLTRIN